jgi:hypothetical protein
MVSQTTYRRHANTMATRSAVPPPPPSSTTPPIPVDVVTGGDDTNFPSSETSPDPVPHQVSLINHLRYMLSQKLVDFNFPPSLVFTTPPTKYSDCYTPGTSGQLLVPNSHCMLSLIDNNSMAVVNYEHFLVEYMGVLNAISLQEARVSVSEVESLINEILDTLQNLDRRKGDEWNKQLYAQLNPSTFIISGEHQRTP